MAAYLEAFLGRIFYSQRGRDAKLISRSIPAITKLPATLLVTSPLGPSPSPLSHSHSQLGANEFPPLSWSLNSHTDSELELRDKIKSFLLVVEDPDAPLPSPVIHGIYYNIPASKTEVRKEDFVQSQSDNQDGNGRLLAGGFSYGVNRRKTIWGGPKPVLGHGMHRYFFSGGGIE
ncbi:hypothetical protein SS1G_00241 [Sclerotinia sclerotiorum 1980 UF-70]|uniref:Phosphatidylethanolamine-binding protein n=2 Tax=Sclerotinia sclerotiorum (strain ATCC 18683 / 1980 / Ss-1) TaxID=665079 RepID=A7E4L9_SCLS1|nr:hypothetical protein SS1G_00241 [Sclerotinia sclerotiorum 1980 UF-70]APA08098.1 hypothetical protein sscle_03g028680 [Sclerotinia sclerotiorum 1980 UF-70]EDN90841.1 hypothetical protein SS1G_00241 [Sclerotinia sclerotiorum 1980 UF-70]